MQKLPGRPATERSGKAVAPYWRDGPVVDLSVVVTAARSTAPDERVEQIRLIADAEHV